MPYGLYISAEGAHAQSKRLEVIANNLANVDTVGFKRMLAVFQARNAEAIDQGLIPAGQGQIENIGGGVKVEATATDFSVGPFRSTGLPTDMALRNEGFFVVRKGDEELLTRAGNFVLNTRGELMTGDGGHVMSDSGTPIVIEQPQAPWEVNTTGEVRQMGNVQRLAIVKPQSLNDIVQAGTNTYRTLKAPQAVPVSERNVTTGFLETSGVSPTSEIVEMIETTRLLEANLNLMQTQDQMMGGLISRLMRV
jgi:flagellar basal-body rod protein FlgF